MENKKVTDLTEATSLGAGSLFYAVDPTRTAGDKDVKIDKDSMADIIGAASGGGSTYRDGANVMDYGAVGDGITDDRGAFVSALAASDVVYIPSGTFLIASDLTLADNKIIVGDGHSSIVKPPINGAAFIFGNRNQLENIHIQGYGKAVNTSRGVFIDGGVSGDASKEHTILNCFFTDLSDDGVHVTRTDYPTHSTGSSFTNNKFISCNKGLVFETKGEYNTITGGAISNCDIGVLVRGGNNTFSSVNISRNAVGVDLVSGTNDGHGMLSVCNINHNTTANLRVTNILNGFTIDACNFYDGAITLASSSDLKFDNCIIGNGATITESGCARSYIDKVLFDGNVTITRDTIVIMNATTIPSGGTPDINGLPTLDGFYNIRVSNGIYSYEGALFTKQFTSGSDSSFDMDTLLNTYDEVYFINTGAGNVTLTNTLGISTPDGTVLAQDKTAGVIKTDLGNRILKGDLA